MSLFFLPTSHPHHGHPFAPAHPSRRCGANALTHSPYDVLRSAPFVVMADEEDEGFFDAQQARYMHQRQQYAHLLRQAELEREREREIHRRRIQRQEEERRLQAAARTAAAVAAALERQEVERRQRAAAAVAAAQARRQRMEWQARQRQQYLAALEHEQQLRRQHDRRRRQAEEQERLAAEQWEEFAAKGIASALDFATHFFGTLTSEGERNSQEGAATTEKGSTAEAALAEHSTNEAEQKQPEQAPEYRMDDVEAHDDPVDVFPEPEVEQRVEVTAPVEKAKSEEREQPIFTLPLPSDPSERAAIKADKIQVTFDESTRSIQLRGLWKNQKNNPPASVDGHSTVGSDSDDDEENSTRGRKRSRSPKRSRVSDVDEKTGEEIEVTEPYADEREDEFVHIDKHSQDGTASIPVAQDVSVANLRAELTDDGFHLYL